MLNLPSILRKSKPGHDDDLKILRNWKEYTDDRKNMKYLMYELEMHEPGGNVVHFYKAIKLTRIIRLPKNAKQSESFMSMHSQVLAAVWERNIKLLTVIANLLNPVPLGMMYLYGVQGVAETAEKAKYIADNDFVAMASTLQGTYRVLEHRILTYDELEWLTEKMYMMDKMTVLRGIPQAKDGGVDVGSKGMGNKSVNPDAQDTTEEYIAGMSDKEYILQIISSPVKSEHLGCWLAQTAQEMTKWNKQLQGMTSMNQYSYDVYGKPRRKSGMEPFLYGCGLCYEHNGREYFFVCCQFRKRVGQSYGRGIYRQIARNQQDRNKRYKSGIFKRSQLCRDARAESKSQYGNNGRGRNQSVFRRFREYVAFGFPKPKSGRISQPVDKRYGFRRRFQQLFAIAVAQPVAYGFNFRIGYEFHNKRCIRKPKLYARVFLYQRCK